MIEEYFRALREQEPWREKAACLGMGFEEFFPERGDSTKLAKSICAKCPVGKQCESFADRSDSNYGMWNGKMRSRAGSAT